MAYYFQGLASWSWCYPYFAAPLPSDLIDLGELYGQIGVEFSAPLLPFQQVQIYICVCVWLLWSQIALSVQNYQVFFIAFISFSYPYLFVLFILAASRAPSFKLGSASSVSASSSYHGVGHVLPKGLSIHPWPAQTRMAWYSHYTICEWAGSCCCVWEGGMDAYMIG